MLEVLVLACVVIILWAIIPAKGPHSPQEEDDHWRD